MTKLATLGQVSHGNRKERKTGMECQNIDADVRDIIQEIVAEIVEVETEQVGWNVNFWDDLEADSLQSIEILSALERRFKITIDQSLLTDMQDVQSTYGLVVAARSNVGSGAS
jgi:acyl carrier protein